MSREESTYDCSAVVPVLVRVEYRVQTQNPVENIGNLLLRLYIIDYHIKLK